EPIGGVMPSKMDGATICAEVAAGGAECGRERTSSLGFGNFDFGVFTASLESSERDAFADSRRAAAEAASCASRREGASPNGEPASPPLFRIQRRLLRSATSI